jgi:hypothetical protein
MKATVIFSACSVPLWLIPVLSAQPPIVGRPVDFSGAIGGPFVVTMSIEPRDVAIEEPFTVTLRIVGSGNLNEIARPALGKLDAFRPFAVDDVDDTFTDGTPPNRTFRYRLRARSDKVAQIPAFKFVYFNPAIVPASRGYQTTYAESVKLAIKPQAAPETGTEKLAFEIADLHRRLALDPGNSELRSALMQARNQVRYANAEMRPTSSRWSYWLGWLTLALCTASGTLAIAAKRMPRRIWVISTVFGVGLAIASAIEWRRWRLDESVPVVVIGAETVLRRGNAHEYPALLSSPLPAGAEVRRVFERHGWVQVELANGILGWVPREVVIE